MAKINISLDLDWIGEDSTLDETIKAEIVNRITDQISDTIINELKESAESQLKNAISQRLNEYMEKIFSEPRTITDKWGEVVKENVSIKDQLVEMLDKFMDQQVDSNGNPTSYGGKSRIYYIVEKTYTNTCASTVERAAREAADTVKKIANETLSKKIGIRLAETIGLKEELGL